MASDEEDEFFATGVDSSVHDRSKKYNLTKYHGKLKNSQEHKDVIDCPG